MFTPSLRRTLFEKNLLGEISTDGNNGGVRGDLEEVASYDLFER
jgi:hydrogenase maturation factor HypE